jgi:hypothetical protein
MWELTIMHGDIGTRVLETSLVVLETARFMFDSKHVLHETVYLV